MNFQGEWGRVLSIKLQCREGDGADQFGGEGEVPAGASAHLTVDDVDLTAAAVTEYLKLL